jgi:hypothetical protein
MKYLLTVFHQWVMGIYLMKRKCSPRSSFRMNALSVANRATVGQGAPRRGGRIPVNWFGLTLPLYRSAYERGLPER